MLRILLITAIVTWGPLQGFSQGKNFIDQPYLETFAKVDTAVTPDRIYLKILITEKDTKGRSPVEELEAKMERALKNLGIDTKQDLTLNDLASNFKKYFLKRQDILKGKVYTLLVRDAQTAGNVIIALEGAGISNIHVDRLEHSKMELIRLGLKAKAVAKAKKQAGYMARAIKQNIGPAIYISDQSIVSVPPTMQGKVAGIQIRGAATIKGDRFEAADIEFKRITVESTVAVNFKLGQ